ncbi:MAG TPA: hypothetical protein VGP77_02380 [Vicinamibacterales bacterium]|nr:hypothetical protein [Vicinamibacterales bacterium]
MADRIHIALFTPGYPYVDAVLRAVRLSRRPGASLSRSIGEPLAPRRDQFAQWLLESDATHALLLEGDIIPPEDVLDRLLLVGAPVVTATYPQWIDGRLSTNVQATTDVSWSDTVSPEIFPVRRCLLGCVLVQRDVFVKVPAPRFLSTMTDVGFLPDDKWFCDAVRRAGLGIRCDGRVLCSSVRQGTDLLAMTGGSIQRT